MIPSIIKFTDLEIDPFEILFPRKHEGPWPSIWTRIQFTAPYHRLFDGLAQFDRWVEENIQGRWGSYALNHSPDYLICVAFEQVNDAIMFRLKNGETAWRTE